MAGEILVDNDYAVMTSETFDSCVKGLPHSSQDTAQVKGARWMQLRNGEMMDYYMLGEFFEDNNPFAFRLRHILIA